MIRILTGLATFLLPSLLLPAVLRLLGHNVGQDFRCGFSVLFLNSLDASEGSAIGHMNLLTCSGIHLGGHARIEHLNIFKGPFQVHLASQSTIGSLNYLTRGGKGISYGESSMRLGRHSNITKGHHIDLTCSVSVGDYCVIGGLGSQLWTHGFVHGDPPPERIRIDGAISILDNVYIGSRCIINPGVSIDDNVHVGAGAVIAENLAGPALYVGQRLRKIEIDIESYKGKLKRVQDDDLLGEVYLKPNNEVGP